MSGLAGSIERVARSLPHPDRQICYVRRFVCAQEGRVAVLRRAQKVGLSLSDVDADGVAGALGHDPLLIALHDPHKKSDSATVIEDFIEGQIVRLAATRQIYPAAKYRLTLRA